MNHTIGTCSLCGGRVVLHEHWMSVRPQIPHCESCGARASQPHGPVIPMERPVPKDLSPLSGEDLAKLANAQESVKGTCWEPLLRTTNWGRKTPPVYDPLRTYRRS